MITFIIALIIGGAITGGLGRLAIPGPNPMSIGMTILVGIGGSFMGGMVGALLFGRNAPSFLLGVAGAALIVWLMERNRKGDATT